MHFSQSKKTTDTTVQNTKEEEIDDKLLDADWLMEDKEEGTESENSAMEEDEDCKGQMIADFMNLKEEVNEWKEKLTSNDRTS